ncbi:MFS transporter [Phycicoccus endophyticus]|uniref:MFS transporter n=1 Tax=Phycicoccus endophyticus TaxID=1690220 RepID=A0A7G9R439_9MICO|nr:MFS transporter [Phycicoccus endophyticus]NHI18207.1 MFS transporter [Phycicoccus endophyticus]QNN50364.1 MFS transporter [Phycicoccus endophyticus]GGL25605.1 MFS transporter [Phycicoccus endophyticus]
MTTVTFAPYRRVLSRAGLRRILVLGALTRAPMFATGVLVTVHVVTTLGRSYGMAGIVGAAVTSAVAVSGPWRGRLLDRYGLRRVVAPSVLVSGTCWALAPFVGYWPLLVLATLAGLFVVPVSSVIRQAVIAAVDEQDRRTAISLDSSVIELSFMATPALAVWAATQWSTVWVLFSVQALGAVAGLGLWLADPPLRSESEPGASVHGVGRAAWFTGPFLTVLVMVAATAVILAGSDLTFVAAVRTLGAVSALGVVLVLWGLGSLVGGLLYGALPREVPARWLLGALALVTAPMALATSVLQLALLALLAGLLCAPTITATVDEVARLVPAQVRGEAMGWHGSSLTAGGALGAPFAGFVVDHYGAGGGFLAVAVVGAAVALLGFAARTPRRGR